MLKKRTVLPAHFIYLIYAYTFQELIFQKVIYLIPYAHLNNVLLL